VDANHGGRPWRHRRDKGFWIRSGKGAGNGREGEDGIIDVGGSRVSDGSGRRSSPGDGEAVVDGRHRRGSNNGKVVEGSDEVGAQRERSMNDVASAV